MYGSRGCTGHPGALDCQNCILAGLFVDTCFLCVKLGSVARMRPLRLPVLVPVALYTAFRTTRRVDDRSAAQRSLYGAGQASR
jgi:hypothetical protein